MKQRSHSTENSEEPLPRFFAVSSGMRNENDGLAFDSTKPLIFGRAELRDALYFFSLEARQY